ncbi:Adaptor protein complex AP-3 delta subunit [Coniochaeta ligniaria NRRL 30616]|uniref:AP-3 complex subunit delta n=1 Tax=Coniochaeta ligniaria NRRL 30616 TaxID=1408157 RepID=A0A1J7IQL8_9PEZI|nr:Adaptor protein complex AP-3 delta subunit [Coniochaeta ligniaria NRRL 30616]
MIAASIVVVFEKSLYDLIRGLRNHKGNEKEYIQNCLKECRAEIRSQDMDLKATALLKLIYLEMNGHDMSWASFHVLEVMSSPKYHQKRVGYLGAVQTFRPDTEVLMLATNLLKKDLTTGMPTTIALPIAALPHIITPSLALSVLADLLPRMNHNLPAIRKKTIVTLYRLALVYPETLRAAWPKIKERLMDKDEDPSVTAAIVNVVCELGWRRPSDFLPLAPRFFELLVDGNNNWMAIKLVKLFATLTPLEPRLIRKLQVPLMDLIRTTPAMSLLYECINGVIQGGILGDSDNTTGTEEIATLCVSKLRSMIMVHNDSNLKYVALLAFNKIVLTHPQLVAEQEDVIIDCIDSEDMTIRMKALDLVQGMVSSDNLVSIVSRLMRQLKASSSAAAAIQRNGSPLQDPDGVSDDEASVRRPRSSKADQPAAPLPEEYTTDVIGRILDMCSKGNYEHIADFEWYIDVLIQLVRVAPVPRARDYEGESSTPSGKHTTDVSEKIGDEIRNVAVKVKDIRYAAVAAADSILQQMSTESSTNYISSGVIKPTAFVVGEFWSQLSSPEDTLGYLLQLIPRTKYPEALATCLQASIKILAAVAGDEQALWTPERKSRISLLMARVIHTLEPLTMHPYLEVQERAVQFAELLKLTAEAVSGQAAATDELHQDPPLLLTQAIPSLFSGWELNSVKPGQQSRVQIPDGLDLDEPIHPNLNALLATADSLGLPVAGEEDEFDVYYNQRPPPTAIANEPAINRLAEAPEEVTGSYQRAGEESYLDPDIVARRKAERRERNKDDPFYIPDSSTSPGRSTPIHNILRHENGPDLDIDSIPIMQLDLEKLQAGLDEPATKKHAIRPKPRQKILIAADETIPSGSVSAGPPTPRQYDSENNNSDSFTRARSKKLRASLLQVDSSVIGSLSLDPDKQPEGFDYERQKQEDAEMAQAVKEVERLRLEMQRANERIKVAQGVPDEGTVLKKKKKVKKSAGEDDEVKTVKKKKKKVAIIDEGGGAEGSGPGVEDGTGEAAAKPKKRKKKVVKLDGEGEVTAQP